jgi:hypothetical protein
VATDDLIPPDDHIPDDGEMVEDEWPRFDRRNHNWERLLVERQRQAGVLPLRPDLDELPIDDDLIDDEEDHLPLDASHMQRFEYKDLIDWGEWLTSRWQLQSHLPPCWPAHHDLRSEVLALRRDWAMTEAGKITLSAFLQSLDYSLSRIARYWRGSCTKTEHVPDRQPPSVRAWAEATAAALYLDAKPTSEPRRDVANGWTVPVVERPASVPERSV